MKWMVASGKEESKGDRIKSVDARRRELIARKVERDG